MNNILLYPVSGALWDILPFNDPKIMFQVKDLAWRTLKTALGDFKLFSFLLKIFDPEQRGAKGKCN